MNRARLLLLSAVAVAPFFQAKPQGCSDAGFCSVGSLKHQVVDSATTSMVHLSFPFGAGDEGTKIFTPAIQYDLRLNNGWAIQSKLTANFAYGNLGAAAGAGDIYVAGIYAKGVSPGWTGLMMLACKLPLNESNLKEDGRPLPMTYQSSLGTADVILGLSLVNRSWNLSVGWQQPISQNGNEFLHRQWEDPAAYAYAETNNFTRRGDVLLRATYTQHIRSRLVLQGGMLTLYHLSEDSYQDDLGPMARRVRIAGSEGLTINLTGSAWLSVSNTLKLGLAAAMPMAVRDVRPDGLTRSFVISPEIQWTIGN